MKFFFVTFTIIILTLPAKSQPADNANVRIFFIEFSSEADQSITMNNITSAATCNKTILINAPNMMRLSNIIGPLNFSNLNPSKDTHFTGQMVRAKILFPEGETVYIEQNGAAFFFGALKQGRYHQASLNNQEFAEVNLYLNMLCDRQPTSHSLGSTTEKEYMNIFTGQKDNYLKLPLIVLREPSKRD